MRMQGERQAIKRHSASLSSSGARSLCFPPTLPRRQAGRHIRYLVYPSSAPLSASPCPPSPLIRLRGDPGQSSTSRSFFLTTQTIDAGFGCTTEKPRPGDGRSSSGAPRTCIAQTSLVFDGVDRLRSTAQELCGMRRPFNLVGLMLSLWFDGGYGFGGGELTSATAILTTFYKGYTPPTCLFTVDVNLDRLAAAVLGMLLHCKVTLPSHPPPDSPYCALWRGVTTGSRH
ncbi:uncharacterized protein [Tursiops truncatus]|uniref:uncharacterized protein isoform X2 n=1 Tax=Tursiops truncatus TaxID=9739 RepID=UPI003CCF1444